MPVSAALWTHLEIGDFILTRIKHMNKYLDAREIIEKKHVIKSSTKYLRASYTERIRQIRILCGSV